MCEKDGYHMSWAVKMVQQICNVFTTDPERFGFIQQLENMFSEVTREFFEFSVAGEVGQLNFISFFRSLLVVPKIYLERKNNSLHQVIPHLFDIAIIKV